MTASAPDPGSDIDTCAEIVQAGDPDRFAATMAAPPSVRARLWPLYALNLEIARAAWVSGEPLICQMRLQWWIDTLRDMPGSPPRAHQVAAPVHHLVRTSPLNPGLLVALAEARFWDTGRDGFGDPAALWIHLDATAGNLMWAAASILGAPAESEAPVRDFAAGAGLAAWFCATEALRDQARSPLPDEGDAAIAALARDGLSRIARARHAAGRVPRPVRPALWTGWQATGLLRQAASEPQRVLSGRLGVSEFSRRGGLLWRALTGSF